MDFGHFTVLVRPHSIWDLDSLGREDVPWNEALLVYGESVEKLCKILPKLEYGSVIVLLSAKEEGAAVVEETARLNNFYTWYSQYPGLPDGARTWVKHAGGNIHTTHLPYLLEAVKRTTGPVLELGSGDGSTPALHKACGETGRLLVTVESDESWMKKFEGLENTSHYFQYLSDPAKTSWLSHMQWSVVFVDHAPGETRTRAVERARNVAEYIVVHDTEELSYGLDPIFRTFRYHRDFRRSRPWTTVVSMTRETW